MAMAPSAAITDSAQQDCIQVASVCQIETQAICHVSANMDIIICMDNVGKLLVSKQFVLLCLLIL